MGGEAGDRRGGAVETAGTRGNRQQGGCERNKRRFLCNRKWWRPAFFIVLSLLFFLQAVKSIKSPFHYILEGNILLLSFYSAGFVFVRQLHY